MGLFDDILMTVDMDRTLTATDGSIPQRNIEAIRYFMENGGHFTVNTGRSNNSMRSYMDKVPVNAPLLLINGSASFEDGHMTNIRTIDLDMWPTLDRVAAEFPEMNLEIQQEDNHYMIRVSQEYIDFYARMGWAQAPAEHGVSYGPFMKFVLYGQPWGNDINCMYQGSAEELARFDAAEAFIKREFADKVEVFRAAPRIIDVHAKGVSKLRAARDLQARLGKKILVCVGDAENDITMLDGADYAYCPADGVVADRYENVCCCADGAVADVIYKKLPEILQMR